MKIFRRTAEYSLLDHKRNEEILEQLKVEPNKVKLRKKRIKLARICVKNEEQ
jgi:hypothetical protein